MNEIAVPSDTAEYPTRVFISYSHDSPEHTARIRALAIQLRSDGIDARIDQFAGNPAEGWPHWCAREIHGASYVLLVCTKAYRRAFFGLTEFGQKRGVKWEGKMIQNIIYYAEVSSGFIPVVFNRSDEAHIPETVKEASWVLLEHPPADRGYQALRARLAGGKTLPSLNLPVPDVDFRIPSCASVPDEETWAPSGRIGTKLDKIREEQAEHERRSTTRHRGLVAGLLFICFLIMAACWFNTWSTERLITDPVILRDKLEQRIDQSFEEKRAGLQMANTKASEVDELFNWRNRAKSRLDGAVEFITAAVGTGRSKLVQRAAAILQERGVDAALEYLDLALHDAQKEHHEKGRELAEAALLKSSFYEARLDFTHTRESIEQAISLDYTWWRPHNQLGLIFHQRAEWGRAESEFEEAEKFVENEEERAAVLNNLARLMQVTNRLPEAEPLMRGALSNSEIIFGPEHPEVALHLNNLAQILQDTNKLAEAEPLIRRSLAIDEKSFGYDDVSIAIPLNNLALLLRATNRLQEAEPLMRRSVAIPEKGLGPDHPNLALSLSNLALLLKNTDQLTEAEPLMQRSIQIYEKSLGKDHPNLAAALNNLARLLQASNRLAEAEPLMRRSLTINERCFGPDHPNVARDLNNLAQILQDDNRLAEAEPLMRRALSIDEKSFDSDHPQIANSLNNLARLLQVTDRMAEAEPLMRRSLIILLKLTRATRHPDPNLRGAFGNYRSLLKQILLDEKSISRRLEELGSQAGFDDDPYHQLLAKMLEAP